MLISPGSQRTFVCVDDRLHQEDGQSGDCWVPVTSKALSDQVRSNVEKYLRLLE